MADPDPIDVDVDVGADETGAAKPSNLGSQEFFLTLIGLLGVVMIIIAVVIWVNRDDGAGDSDVAIGDDGAATPSSTLGVGDLAVPAGVPTTVADAVGRPGSGERCSTARRSEPFGRARPRSGGPCGSGRSSAGSGATDGTEHHGSDDPPARAKCRPRSLYGSYPQHGIGDADHGSGDHGQSDNGWFVIRCTKHRW